MAVSDIETKFLAFASFLDEVKSKNVDPKDVDVILASTVLNLLNGIGRMRPAPPNSKLLGMSLREEINTQIRTLLGMDVEWNETVRKQFFDRRIAILDTFLSDDDKDPKDLMEVASCMRVIVAGFEMYRAKMEAGH